MSEHLAVWTGGEMLVCCGRQVGGGEKAASYSPTTDTWKSFPAPPGLSATFAEGVWTGEELFVFGGVNVGGSVALLGGAAYSPETGSWRTTSDLPHKLERSADAVWGDGVIYAWPSSKRLGPPLAYEPATDTWTALSPPPLEPDSPSLVWTGRELLAWGLLETVGEFDSEASGVGLRFDPDTATWMELPPAPLEPVDSSDGTADSQAVAWTGEEMIVWTGWIGGEWDDSSTPVVAFNPETNVWRELPVAPISPRGMYQAPLLWTGEHLIAYGDPILVWHSP